MSRLWSLSAIALCACSRADPPPAYTPDAAPSASASAPSASASAPAPFYCFQWIHGSAWSDDCYRSPVTCEEERKSTERGARPTRPCQPAKEASCTVVRPDADRLERCFADEGACARYRTMITERGLPSTACQRR